MKLKSPKNSKNTSSPHTNNFQIGDLVLYSPRFHDPDGPWVMSGDIGIVIESKLLPDYQIVKVKWIDFSMGETDMSTEVLTKIVLDKHE